MNEEKNIYKLKDYLEKDNYLMPSLLRESGIVLSYGSDDDFVPAGVFGVSRFVDRNKDTITEEVSSIHDVLIEFTEVEYINSEGVRKKINGSKVYIPYLDFVKIYRNYSLDNFNILKDIMPVENLESLSLFEKITEEYMGENPGIESYDSINFQGETIDDLGGEFIIGEISEGNNYKVIPFEFGMVKKLIKTKTMENNYETSKESDYVYIESNNSTEKNYYNEPLIKTNYVDEREKVKTR